MEMGKSPSALPSLQFLKQVCASLDVGFSAIV